MPVEYGCIVRNGEIDGEYPSKQTVYREKIKLLISKLAPQNQRRIFDSEGKRFYCDVVNEEDKSRGDKEDTLYIYVCVADEDYPIRVCTTMLDRLKQNRSNQKSLRNLIKAEMQIANDPKSDSLLRVQSKIAAVREDMMANIEKLMDNLDKVDNLVSQTDELSANSRTFSKKARTLKQAVFWNNFKFLIILIFLISFIVFVGVWLACKFPDFSRCTQYVTGGTGSSGDDDDEY